MEREKGFESASLRVLSLLYAGADPAPQGSTRPPDASGRVATELDGGDSREPEPRLLAPTPDLFIAAGAIAAERAARGQAPRVQVEEILRRAVDQAAALRGEAA
jgi:hypothetical protein